MAEKRFLNQFPKAILRSPLHSLMSRRFLLLSFQGRKTGRRYQLPLAYLRRNGNVIMTTDSGWWRNLKGGRPVQLQLTGRTLKGTAWAVTDDAEVGAALRELLAAQPSYARLAGLHTNADGSLDLAQAARDRVLIHVELEAAA
jgi:deazaflavin-dependent oxidoreductase (nitroreductase family)